MLDSLLSLLMTFILMILSIFGGTGEGFMPDQNEDEDVQVSYNYTINDDYYEFRNLQYGDNAERNILDLYVPRTNTKCEMGLIVYIHGGGWLLGDKDSSGYSAAAKDYAINNGYACAAINYSYLSDEVNMNDILEDITDALTAIHIAGKQVAVTIEDALLYGYSAGAHLALQYAYSSAFDSPIIPVAVVSIAGPSNLAAEEYWTTANDMNVNEDYYDYVADGSGKSALQYILSCAIGKDIKSYDDVLKYSKELLDISPVSYVDSAVATVLVHGKNDITVPYENSVELDNLLTAANIKHKFISYDNYGHEVGSTTAALEEINKYLDTYAYEYLISVADKMDIEEPFEFTYLEYPAEAVKTLDDNNVSVSVLTARANKNDNDVYAACQGYDDVNGVVISPYYTATVEGTSVPVYATTVYVGSTGTGALHSYSEIYITDDMADNTFDLQIKSATLKIKDAVYMTTSEKVSASVSSGTVSVSLSGYGIYTFLFNSESQEYAYTIFVREEVDDDAKIAELEAQGYTVVLCEGYIDNVSRDLYYMDITGYSKTVIYLKKGCYIEAASKQNIASESDLYSEGTDLAGIGGLTRYPFCGGSGVNDVKIMGYGTIDFNHLDRTERKGIVLSWGSNIEISGIKIINSSEWAIQTYRIDGLTIKDVDIFGYRLNSDAFDICNTQNATITNCFARSGDDLFAIKTLGGEDAASCYTTNVTVSDCVAWAGKARAFGISGEANLNISDVTFKDCAVLCHDATWGEYNIAAIGIMVEECSKSGNTISNVAFENIKIYRNDSAAFSLYALENISGSVAMKNVTFKNIYYNSNTVKSKVYSTNSGSSMQATLTNVYCGTTKLPGSDYANYIDTTSNVSLAFY